MKGLESMHKLGLLAATALATTGVSGAAAQEKGTPGLKRPEFTVTGSVNKPTQLPPNVAGLRVPPGYTIGIAARDLGNARMVAVARDGTVYITRRAEADLLMLKDRDGDGAYEVKQVVAARPNLHGLAIDGATMFLVGARMLWSAPINADGTLGELRTLADDLPDAGQHANRTLAVGPDGRLFVSVGSTCNECNESNAENATLLAMTKEGKSRRIYASGLRNTIGFDWNPRDGALWGLDQGIDWLGDEDQPEELNRIEQGKRYGWPYIYADGRKNPHQQPQNGLTPEDWDRMSQRMVMGYTAHAAAMQLKFAHGSAFPSDTQGDAFATFRGSWNRAAPSGYEVVRVHFDTFGKPTAMEPFLTGFLTTAPGGEAGWTGRPTGLAFTPDGAMLVTDSENGVLYRIRYAGTDAARPQGAPIVTQELPPTVPPALIALDRPETRATGRLTVTSSAFANGGAIPRKYTRYFDNFSPPLAWSGAPAATRAYVLIMDDPFNPTRLVNHWTAFNLAATALPEGVPVNAQTPPPLSARQGVATAGQLGYVGPRPPVGDAPHPYHFQVFALDTALTLDPGATREQVLGAMKGHVLAKGELVGRYAQPTPPPKL